MVLMTRSPSVRVGLQKETTLHCQFAVDHKVPHLTVEWHFQRRGGRRTKLFSYSSRSGQTEGSGVAVKGIAGGCLLTVPITKVSSEGTYVCSVRVPPLNGSVDIALHIIEPPDVSLTTKEEQIPSVVCEANGFYPWMWRLTFSRRLAVVNGLRSWGTSCALVTSNIMTILTLWQPSSGCGPPLRTRGAQYIPVECHT
ncbi:tapasin-related protein-like, partial [Oncorhynchus tshawytscha]|uniref:tapasin-related protein-like n=1 Tax=Oncorhynchus tshawytscha TaxID=74940 RepID=UPI001C3C6CBA